MVEVSEYCWKCGEPTYAHDGRNLCCEFVSAVRQSDYLQLKAAFDIEHPTLLNLKKEYDKLRAENEKLAKDRDYYEHEFALAQHESDKYKTRIEELQAELVGK